MSRARLTTLTNICLLTTKDHRILVQDRQKPDWPGITFPGGHVEAGESLQAAMIREFFEETGLTLEDPQLCGVLDFTTEENEAYLVLLYRAHSFKGQLQDSREGRVFWIKDSELPQQNLSADLWAMYQVMQSDSLSEVYGTGHDASWKTQLY
ncbi:8-oxo-dGTP diphosphatase [Lactobacillus sp. DCY120]|uniref:8-oxo-dGTP diphosphatase n=1 Tax=Bombilactobacillus apium TaxID=2675299 RepID=A0A850R136_9LACO|nr:8-oxo-dGTP diphosphatase [Bombilactobacillus apium]NVY96070.1 8-oxo-dGTP diphosphatase [Bombilactobacillus apium]